MWSKQSIKNCKKNLLLESSPRRNDFKLQKIKCSFELKRVDLEKVSKMTSKRNHVKDFGLQDKLGKRNFHADLKRILNKLLIPSKQFQRYDKKLDANGKRGLQNICACKWKRFRNIER